MVFSGFALSVCGVFDLSLFCNVDTARCRRRTSSLQGQRWSLGLKPESLYTETDSQKSAPKIHSGRVTENRIGRSFVCATSNGRIGNEIQHRRAKIEGLGWCDPTALPMAGFTLNASCTASLRTWLRTRRRCTQDICDAPRD